MEPVTYLSGLSTLICSYLFFLYVSVTIDHRLIYIAHISTCLIVWGISTTERVRIHDSRHPTHTDMKSLVSYSSVLDLSVSARQKILYEKAGLDIDRWTEMG